LKLEPSEPLPPEELLAQPLHVLVRDYPELLPVFVAKGIALEDTGGIPLRDIISGKGGLLEEILAVLEWRIPRPTVSR
jgi:hypothetical protein